MRKTLLEIFQYQNKSLKMDKSLALELRQFISDFITKNEDHVKFFSSTLVGVYQPKFTKLDENRIWNLVEMDKLAVRKDIESLAEVDEDYNVATDPLNHLFLYLMHLTRTSTMPVRLQDITITNLFVILQIKFVTSLLDNYYPHPVNYDLAVTVHQRLSKRFILRQFSTWREVMLYRANNFFNNPQREGNIKVNRAIKDYNIVQEVVDVFTGVQTAVRRSLVEYNQVFYIVYDEEHRVTSTSELGIIEGDSVVKEKISVINNYHNYLHKIAGSENDLIKDDLLTILIKNIAGVRYKPVYRVLRYIAMNYGERKQDDIKEFVDDTLTFALNFIQRNKINTKDLPTTMKRIQGAVSSARSEEAALLTTRTKGDNIVERAMGKKTYKGTVVTIRTTVMVYLVMRTLTMSHYSNKE